MGREYEQKSIFLPFLYHVWSYSMNHIFRVIWNTSIQSWSVVSELSRAHKKQSVSNSQSSAVNLSGVFKLSAIALSFFTASSVYAAVSDNDFTALQGRVAALENQHTSLNNAVTEINNKLNATSVAIGESAVASGSDTTVVGAGAKAVENNSVAIGKSAVSSFINATAMGAGAKAAGAGSVAIGKDATAEHGVDAAVGAQSAIAIGDGAKAQNNRAIAIGKSTVATGQSSIAFGENANAGGDSDVAIGINSKSTKGWGVAIGVDAKSNATKGLSLGYGSVVTGVAGTAIANTAKSLGDYSVAIGDGAESKGNQSLALGSSAKSEGDVSFAAGLKAEANAEASTAIGVFAKVMDGKSINSVVIGTVSKITNSQSSVAIGTNSQITDSQSSVAIGQTAKNTSSQYSVALGESALNTASNLGVAIGSEAKNDTSVRGTAIGFRANTKGQDTIAFGTQATSSADRAVSIGINSIAKARDSYAIGTQASSLSSEAVAIGNSAAINEKAANSIAIGSGAYVGVQNATSKVGNTLAKVSQPLQRITDNNEISVITQAESHKYDWSMAIGHDSRAYGYQTLALGNNAEAYDTNSTAVGMGSSAKGHFSNALGYLAKTEGKYATAIGYNSVAAAESATAVGTRAVSNLKGAVALGSDSRTSVDKNVFGYDTVENANKTLENLLSAEEKEKYNKLLDEIRELETERTTLENNLIAYITDAANDPEGKTDEQKDAIKTEKARLGALVTAKQEEIKTKQTKANNMVKVWRSTGAAVSVGDVGTGLTRQITNVAAGTEDTDAVNVAQLKSLVVAGIQFSANDYDKDDHSDNMKAKIIKKQIGGILPIQGKSGAVYGSSNAPAVNYSSDNLITFNDGGTLRIGMLKEPTFSSIKLGDTNSKVLTVDNGKLNFDGNEVVTTNNFKTIFNGLYEFKNGLKTSIEGDKTVVSLDKDSLKNDPSFKGDKGDKGDDGKSAYDAWKEIPANAGKTKDEFLASIKGDKGDKGDDGKSAYDAWKEIPANAGKTKDEFLASIKGDKGDKGDDGKSAYDAWKEIPANAGKTKDEFLASIKGDKGDKGDDGKSAYEIWKAQAGNENKSAQEFADSLKGTNGKDGKSVKATVTDNSDGTHTLEVTNSDNTKTSTKIKDGKNGKSAYEIWRDNGNIGKTEQQFVDSLNANTKLKERVDTIENTVHNHGREIQQNRNAIAQVNRDMQKMNKELRAGIAGAIAIGSLYQNTIPGKETISAGLGSFKGQNAVAVGYSRLSDNGRVGMKANISINSSGDAGAGASIGYTW